jgi:hypothetical protein
MKRYTPHPPWVVKWFIRLAMRPLAGFAIYVATILAVAVVEPGSFGPMIAGLLGPWFVILFGLINAPVVAAAITRFRMSEAVKRNHALEHGTIYFLYQRCGPSARFSGRADEKGFRLSGVQKTNDVHAAFSDLLKSIGRGGGWQVVSPNCGSMIVTAQAFGCSLLSTVLLIVVFLRPSIWVVLALVALSLGVFSALRFRLGMWLQKKFFLSLSFSEASIATIREVSERHWPERPKVVFVKTSVS